MRRTLIFAGGGTAGHVAPALAVAKAWLQRHPHDECIFLGTPDGLENTLVPAAGYELRLISKVSMPRKVGTDLLLLPLRFFLSVNSARKAIKGSSLVVGFGGYLSASAYFAARISGVPIVVHEANAKVGWANRLGAMLTDRLAIAHRVESGPFARAEVAGLPLRQDVKDSYERARKDWHLARRDAKEKLGWDATKPTVLVLGGSQGSVYLNAQIAAALPELESKGIQILHSVGGKNELPPSTETYKAVPYISEMATAYLASDLVIARSGAVTCAEFGTLGRYAVFIPLPIGNGEQARNADFLVEAGRATVVPQSEFSTAWLLGNIDHMLIRSERASEVGLASDIGAEEKIVALMERALTGVES